nr:MAG TPA: hypothetical protein [Caudoviricetes sp.]
MKPSYEELEAKCLALAAENAHMQQVIGDVQTLYYESDGIVGYHLNGDIAKWDDVMPDLWAETPSTDAFLAEVKREATEPLEKEIEGLKKHLLMSVGDIRDLIDYNPETGVLTAKANFSGRQAGSVIGSQTWQGYFGDDECETCDGSGRIEITVPVSWTNIKAIWAKGVEHFSAAPQQEAE